MQKPANPNGFDYKELVRIGYDRCAKEYSKSRQATIVPELQFLIQTLPSSAAALDIGCGSGVPVTSALAKTCSVTGVDISSVQLALARQNVPQGKFLRGDIMTMTFPEGSFDAVVTFYAIFHIPKEEHRELFSRIHRWLKPNGFLLASISERNEDPYTEDDFFGGTMYWSNWGIAEYRQMLTEIGFSLLEQCTLSHGFKQGVKTKSETHPLIYAKKA